MGFLPGLTGADTCSQLPLGGVSIFLLLIITTVLGIAFHRVYFHPLAKFPGPFWASLSSWPAYIQTLRGDRHIWLLRLQEQYGTSFRYTPNSILINTPSAQKTIFGAKANVAKGDYYRVYPRTVDHATTWNSIDREVHARKRRVLNQAFSDKALRNAEPFIHSNVDRWTELLEDEIGPSGWSGSLDMDEWSNNLIFDILGDLCFGKSFDMKEPQNRLRFVPKLMTDFLRIIHPMAFSPFAATWIWLKPRGLDKVLASTAPPALKEWEGFVDECFSERAKLEEDIRNSAKPESEIRKDFFHYLFAAVDSVTGKLGYTRNELFGESETLIIAGSDTTAITTAAAVFYLSRNPEVQAKLAKEVSAAFPSEHDIKSGAVLQACKYLRAFIQECLRINPPVPAELNREVLAGGIMVDGRHLPAGVNVSTASYCLHMNPDIFPEPYRFRPERWIAHDHDKMGASLECLALAESAYCPFSSGPRGCIGKNLAYLELSIIIAKIVYQFELRPDPGNNIGAGGPDQIPGRQERGQYQLHEIFVCIREGPMIQLKKRVW